MTPSIVAADVSALAGLRVLDISGPAGNYCGKLLAELGAEVVLIEPPDGTGLRHEAPFVRDQPGVERSLTHAYYNTSKRSIVVDLDQPDGPDTVRALAATADLIIETERPGRLDQLGLGYSDLRAHNPRLVMASITPFGQTGPFVQYQAEDIICLALGGLLYLGGYPDTAPVQACERQAYAAGALFGAVGAVLALLSAEATGVGQHVDVSIQEAVCLALENAAQFYDLEGRVRRRWGAQQRQAGVGMFECADGYVYLLANGLAGNRFWANFVQWLLDESVPGAQQLVGDDWTEREKIENEEYKRVFREVFVRFSRHRTRAQLYMEAQRRRIPLAPVNRPIDLPDNEQLRYREFFVTVADPLLGELTMPGAPYTLSATPWRLKNPAPRLGEHTAEILAELSASGPVSSVASERRRAPVAKPPLAGVRVADFCWVGAGSYTTKLLADAGADVIKIETSEHIDQLRVAPPFKDGVKGVNRSGYFADRNSSKRSLTLNLKVDGAVELAKALIGRSDIVTNNFSPGTMERLGLGYSDVRALNPGVIYLEMSMQGAWGPHRDFLGYGLTIGALTGFQHLIGLPGRQPSGTGTNYPDHIPNPTHAALAVLAALRHRRLTGEGQYIELAQTEPTIAVLGAAVLAATVNGDPGEARGNRRPGYAPHGVFPCAGDDRWIAIAVADEAQWQGLCWVLGLEDAASNWASASARLADQDRLERAVAELTSRWDQAGLMAALQTAGVAAGAVSSSADVVDRDPQLRHRGHWVRLDHPKMGPTLYNRPPFVLSDTPVGLRSPAPTLGQDTREICTDLLGLTEQEVDDLMARGVLT